MKKNIFKPKILLFIVLFIIIVAGIIVAINITSEGYRLNKNTIMQVVSPSYCYEANNTGSANDYFVPTKTDAELISFVSYTPGDVDVYDCAPYPPRIAYWSGKVNQHTDETTGVWTVDPDCTSGDGIDMLTYCRKWYSETITYSAYATETITTWTDAGCANLYTSAKQSYECVLCSAYYPESSCESAGCYWHYYGYDCSLLQCYQYYSYSDCTAIGCYWDGYNCVESPSCGYWYSETECENDYDCNWDGYNYCCYDLYDSCSSYYSQYDCEMYGCQWDSYNYHCHEYC